MTDEKKNENNYFNIIFFVSTIILAIIIPKIFKLNRKSFILGFIIQILIIHFFFYFLNIYYNDDSWYTEQYQVNNSKIYKEAFKDIFRDIKNGLKNGAEYIFSSINNYTFRPIRNAFKYILPKSKKVK